MTQLHTQRLTLRQWIAGDEPAMAAINRHPEVGRYLNRPVDEATVAGFAAMIADHWITHGFGPWAIEYERRFVGFAGLAHLPPFLSAAGRGPELGWRLAPSVWGLGLATEAALAARDDAFERLQLPEVISVIHPDNTRSQRVATKLGMRLDRHVPNPVLDRDVEVWRLRRPAHVR